MGTTMRFGSESGNPASKPIKAKLWKNSDPSQSFAAQTVTLSNSLRNYDFLWITYFFSSSTQTMDSRLYLVSDLLDEGYTAGLRVSASSNNRVGGRTLTTPTDATVDFGSATYNGNTNNSYVIPAAVYGIKL